jgi:hypothetical protein
VIKYLSSVGGDQDEILDLEIVPQGDGRNHQQEPQKEEEGSFHSEGTIDLHPPDPEDGRGQEEKNIGLGDHRQPEKDAGNEESPGGRTGEDSLPGFEERQNYQGVEEDNQGFRFQRQFEEGHISVKQQEKCPEKTSRSTEHFLAYEVDKEDIEASQEDLKKGQPFPAFSVNLVEKQVDVEVKRAQVEEAFPQIEAFA